MTPLKSYMGDLTHDTIILVSDTIPINVGYIAAYAKQKYGYQIDLTLFKYPQSIIDAIKAQPPDVLALSNYSWNSHLSERVAGLVLPCGIPSAPRREGLVAERLSCMLKVLRSRAHNHAMTRLTTRPDRHV